MSHTTYNIIGTIIGVAALIALCVALYSFIFMVVRWKTPERRRHLARLVYAVITQLCLAGIQYAILFLVFLPALGRQQMAELRAARAQRQNGATHDLNR